MLRVVKQEERVWKCPLVRALLAKDCAAEVVLVSVALRLTRDARRWEAPAWKCPTAKELLAKVFVPEVRAFSAAFRKRSELFLFCKELGFQFFKVFAFFEQDRCAGAGGSCMDPAACQGLGGKARFC